MAGNGVAELEEALAGKCSHSATHGEAIADGNEADIRLVQFVDQPHVGKDIRVAHVIDRRAVFEMQHQAIGIAECMRHTVLGDLRGGVQRIGEGDGKAVEAHRTAGVAHLKLLDTLGAEPCGKIGIGEHCRSRFCRQLHRITHMIAVAVGQENMGDAVCCVLGILSGKAWISGEKRIDQDLCVACFKTESGMA